MVTSLMVFHAIISVLLIVMVLLQFGKGAEAGLMSGGGGESMMSLGQQGNILSKITIVLSVIFMANSILLAKLQSNSSSKSLLDSEAPVARPLNSDALKTDSAKGEAADPAVGKPNSGADKDAKTPTK